MLQFILIFLNLIDVQTNRLIKAAQNPSVDIIFHPTGRIINKRDGYPVDIPKLMTIANETNTILEIDSHYNRLDLRDEYIRTAIQNDVKLVVDSDAHHPLHYAFLEFGIGQARRGWAGRKDRDLAYRHPRGGDARCRRRAVPPQPSVCADRHSNPRAPRSSRYARLMAWRSRDAVPLSAAGALDASGHSRPGGRVDRCRRLDDLP